MNIFTSSAPKSSARHKPVRNASYLAWLFEVGKDNAWETSIQVPSSFSNIILAPLPFELEAPSMKIVLRHTPSWGSGKVLSTTK